MKGKSDALQQKMRSEMGGGDDAGANANNAADGAGGEVKVVEGGSAGAEDEGAEVAEHVE